MWNTWKEPLMNLVGIHVLAILILGSGMAIGLGLQYINPML